MEKRVSILIPAYNAEKWISETIKSALDQFWLNKEIIVVNDGSKDRTLDVVRRYESSGIKIISQENRGASAARNKAFEYATGDYIQWLDADDLISSNKISSQMLAISSDNDDMLLYCCPQRVFYYRKEKGKKTPNALWRSLSPVDWMITALNDSLWMNPAAWLTSRKLIEKAGLWDTRLSLNDDGEYFFRLVGASNGVKFVPGCECFYRESGFSQLSKSKSKRACQSFLLSVLLSIKSLMKIENSERAREACLKFVKRNYRVVYPNYPELMKDFCNLAIELGGKLEEPKADIKIKLLNKIFGQKTAIKISKLSRRAKLFTKVKADKTLFLFENFIYKKESKL